MATADPTGVTARSGGDGKIVVGTTKVARATQFNLTASASASEWGDSDSEGYTNRKTNRKDCTGQLQGKFDKNAKIYALFMPGDVVELTLWENSADYWNFPSALITDFQITYDMDTREVVGWTASFGADGKFWRPGQSGAPTETLPSS